MNISRSSLRLVSVYDGVRQMTCLVITTMILIGCGPTSHRMLHGKPDKSHETSALKVTDVKHTPVKRQAIGNCWIYATSTWIESLHLAQTGDEIDLSESYWTYMDWKSKILDGATTLETGGSWVSSSHIIARHGYMIEGDFIPEEAREDMSLRQRTAEAILAKELAEGGRLFGAQTRTPETVTEVLDEAFQVSLSDLKPKIHAAKELIVGARPDGRKITLDRVLAGGSFRDSWNIVSYPVTNSADESGLDWFKKRRSEVLNRVMKALNHRRPVIMSVDVDFNAMRIDPYATFDVETLWANGNMGRQGGHLLVLKDYTVSDVPDVGELGEGDMSPEMKEKALLGNLTSLKAKNSWGKNRPDKGLIEGFTSFKRNYIDAAIPWGPEGEKPTPENSTLRSPVSYFVLPPGY